MSNNLGTDLEELLPQRGQQPVLDLLRQYRLLLLAEGVEEVGANRFCAPIVLVGWA